MEDCKLGLLEIASRGGVTTFNCKFMASTNQRHKSYSIYSNVQTLEGSIGAKSNRGRNCKRLSIKCIE